MATLSGPSTASARRGIASAVLAVAIFAVGGVAVGVLAHPPASSTADTAPVAAAPAAPVTPAPAPSSPAPAPAAATDGPADGPAVVDTAGTPLPAPVTAGVRSAFTTLAAGNVDALAPAYVPSRTVRASPWPTVAGLLRDPATRVKPLAALRAAPTRTPDGWRYATPDGNQVGVDAQGHISYLRLS